MITVLGSLNMDLITKTERIPDIGETVWGGEFKMSAGGKGLNQAVAAGRLSGDVSFLGKIGDDYFGKKLLKKMKREPIDTTYLKIEENRQTGIASIMADSKGRNIITVAPNVNSTVSLEEFKGVEELLKETNIFLTQLELPVSTVKEGIEKASESETKIILNPAPARSIPKRIFEKVDILIPNKIETFDLAGIDRNSTSVKNAAEKLLGYGPETVIVTMGAEGVLLVSEKKISKFNTIDVKVTDTTGAGDAFCGTLAAALDSGKSISEAVKRGNIAAGLSVSRVGAQESLPTLEEVDNYQE